MLGHIAARDLYDLPSYRAKLGIDRPPAHQWIAFVALLSRPYFRRTWIVQELTLAKAVVALCGNHITTVDWTEALGMPGLRFLADREPQGAELIKPDYTSAMTPERLFTRATRLLLESRRDLRLLVTKESPIMTQIRTLPSWVPGYTVAHVPNPLGVPLGSVFLACGTMEWTHDGRRYDDPLLGVQGYCLGSIEQHSMNPFLPDGRYANSPAEESLVWGTICDVAAGLGDYYRVQPS